MRILHIYDENDSMAARYVSMLSASLANVEHSTISISTSTFNLKPSTFDERPDIVHLHGAPSVTLPRDDYRLVITPHGHPLVRRDAYVIVARSQTELAGLASSHERIAVVRNPVITRTTTPEHLASQMFAIYQRVMRSNVLPLMSAVTRRTLAASLCAAITGDRRWVPALQGGEKENLTEEDITLLRIYAYYEGVLPLVQQGMQLLNFPTALLSTLNIPFSAQANETSERALTPYLPSGYRIPEPLSASPVSSQNETENPDVEELGKVSRLILDIRQHSPSLLRLTELHATLLDEHLDEQHLISQLDEQHLLPLFAAILQLLSEQTLLTEGFMPCKPVDGPLTQQLRQQLAARQQLP